MRLLYSLGIFAYSLAIRLAALFGHDKARLMVAGWRATLSSDPLPSDRPVVWFHAASLGEFEQARPVIEAFHNRHPDFRIVLSFFSPSGYEVRHNYPLADRVFYLPPDSRSNARRLLRSIHPDIAFFVKYDLWYNTLDALRQRGSTVYLFSAIFRPTQYFFKPWGRWFVARLNQCFSHIFVQNDQSLHLLQSHGIMQCSLAGDTRFDRVRQIALEQASDRIAEAFLSDTHSPVLVCGSTWPPDEALLASSLASLQHLSLRLIIAPHQIGEAHLRQIQDLFPNSIRYSQFDNRRGNEQVLIIDNIGILSHLYRYANVAYIGGGFGAGIHNTLEAITFGKPVLFGPNYHKFKEACDILRCGGGFTHSDQASLRDNISLLFGNPDALASASKACTDYMQHNLGSTDTILSTIEK